MAVNRPIPVPVPQIVRVAQHVPIPIERPVPVPLPHHIPFLIARPIPLPHPVPIPRPIYIPVHHHHHQAEPVSFYNIFTSEVKTTILTSDF